MDRHRTGYLHVFFQWRGLEHQHVGPGGQRQVGFFGTEKFLRFPLVESARGHHRLSRRYVAPDGGNRMAGVEQIVGGRVRALGLVGGQAAAGMQVEGGVQGAGQGPFVLVAPPAPVLQAQMGVLASRAAAHDEQLNRGFRFPTVVLALEPAVEEPQPQVVKILRRVVVPVVVPVVSSAGSDHGRLAQVDVAGIGHRARTVGPGPHQQGNGAFLGTGEGHEIIGGRPGIWVVPGAHVHLGHIGKLVIIRLSAEPYLSPVVVEVLPVPDVQQVVFVVGGPLQWRVPLLPGQPFEPIKDILRLDRRLDGVGICVGLPALNGLFVRPGQLAQFEGPAVAAGVEKGIGEPARVQPHAAQIRWVQTGRRRLGMGRVGEPVGADLAAVPGLFGQPFHGVVAIFSLCRVLGEPALRSVASPAVLKHRDIPVGGEEHRL